MLNRKEFILGGALTVLGMFGAACAPRTYCVRVGEPDEGYVYYDPKYPLAVKSVNIPEARIETLDQYPKMVAANVNYRGDTYQELLPAHLLAVAVPDMWVMEQGRRGISGGFPVVDWTKYSLFSQDNKNPASTEIFNILNPEQYPFFVFDSDDDYVLHKQLGSVVRFYSPESPLTEDALNLIDQRFIRYGIPVLFKRNSDSIDPLSYQQLQDFMGEEGNSMLIANNMITTPIRRLLRIESAEINLLS